MMLRIWRCHDWECVHVLSGHKEPITCVSIHPSGKLALSVSKDNTMKLWNLVQGRFDFFFSPLSTCFCSSSNFVWNACSVYYLLYDVKHHCLNYNNYYVHKHGHTHTHLLPPLPLHCNCHCNCHCHGHCHWQVDVPSHGDWEELQTRLCGIPPEIIIC